MPLQTNPLPRSSDFFCSSSCLLLTQLAFLSVGAWLFLLTEFPPGYLSCHHTCLCCLGFCCCCGSHTPTPVPSAVPSALPMQHNSSLSHCPSPAAWAPRCVRPLPSSAVTAVDKLRSQQIWRVTGILKEGITFYQKIIPC